MEEGDIPLPIGWLLAILAGVFFYLHHPVAGLVCVLLWFCYCLLLSYICNVMLWRALCRSGSGAYPQKSTPNRTQYDSDCP